MGDRIYVSSCKDDEMELGTWMRRCCKALRDKGISLDGVLTEYRPKPGLRQTMISVGALCRLVEQHRIEIDRSGYLNSNGLVTDD